MNPKNFTAFVIFAKLKKGNFRFIGNYGFFKMGDVFLEQLVKRKDSVKTLILKALIFLAGAIVFSFTLLLLPNPIFGTFALLLGVAALYLAWILATGLNLEFEYIYTNGEIDFDKIVAKRKRKRIITIRISSFEDFDRYDPQKIDKNKYAVKYDLSASLIQEDAYYATFHNKEGKDCILLFNPDERLLEAINLQYRRKNYGR